jgi:hypothetical protein
MPRRGTTHLVTLALAITLALPVAAQSPPAPPPEDPEVGAVLGPEERARLLEIVRGAAAAADESDGETVFLVSATTEVLEKDDPDRLRPLVSAVVFDYRDGRATRYRVDLRSGEVLGRDVLPGVPQPSRAEFQRAVEVIRSSPELEELANGDVVFEGGFLADPPAEMAPDEARRQRLVEVHVLSADRSEILRFVTVSLAEGRVVSAVRPELPPPGKHDPKKHGEGRHDHAA